VNLINRQHYLSILKLKYQEPSLQYLESLVAAQLQNFPYENVSKLFYAKSGIKNIPNLNQYLNDNEKYGFGSTCYAQNLYFSHLLNALGFKSEIVLSWVDGVKKDHISCKIRFGLASYVVDFGFMNSFSGPFNLNSSIIRQVIGGRTFLFIPKEQENFRIEIHREEGLQRFFDSAEIIVSEDELNNSIKDSFSLEALFMKSLVISQRWGNPTYTIFNREFIIGKGEKAIKRKILDINDLKKIIFHEMNLASYPIDHALEFLTKNGSSFF
jgi:N-hydroxyarylamine O-acetyltransferase